MGVELDNSVTQCWTTKRKSALVISIMKGLTTSAAAARHFSTALSAPRCVLKNLQPIIGLLDNS